MGDAGSGAVRDKDKAFLAEIIARVNDLFTGDLTDGDQLVYVNDVIKGKMLESDVLVSQAANNTKAQFAASPKPRVLTQPRPTSDIESIANRRLADRVLGRGSFHIRERSGVRYEQGRGQCCP